MNKIKVAIGVILVFFVGAFAGALVSGMYIKHRIEQFTAGGLGRIALKSRLIDRLSAELDLSSAQKLEIERIFDEHQARTSRVRQQYLPQIRDISDQSLAKIRDTLNQDQVQKLDELRRKLKPLRPPLPPDFGLLAISLEERVNMMRERLKLTPEQTLAVRRIFEDRVARGQELRKKQIRGEEPDSGSMRRQMRALQRSLEKSLAETLSEQQMIEYKTILEEERIKRFNKGRVRVDQPPRQ